MNKYLPWLISILLLVGFAYQSYEFYQLKRSLAESNAVIASKLQSFDEALGRAEVKIDSTGEIIRGLQSEIPKEILEEIKKNNVSIEAIAKAVVENRGEGGGRIVRRSPIPSSRIETGGDANTSDGGYKLGAPGVSIIREEIAPREDWDFSDWRLSITLIGEELKYKLHQKFDVLLVEGSRDGATPYYLKVWELGPGGERLDPPLVTKEFSVFKRRDSPRKFQSLNPKLEVALSSGVNLRNASYSPSPEVALSFMSYGETSDDLGWRFARVGAVVDTEGIGISVSPVSYNLGKDLPLVSNVWVSPTYIYKNDHFIGLSLGGVL